MKWNRKRDVLPLIVLVLSTLLTLYFARILPDVIPSHYDSRGVPDAYSSKTSFFVLELSLILGVYLLLTFIPFIDPFWKRIEKKYDIFLIFRDLALVFFLFFYIETLYSALKGTFQTKEFGIGFGLLFILLGNYLPKLPRNFFFGVRSPWTLASEVVWRKTHYLSGWLFVAAGILTVLLSLLGIDFVVVMLTTILPVALVSAIIYPLFLYKKLQREGKLSEPEL
jgi:uncharacterized membrane protein